MSEPQVTITLGRTGRKVIKRPQVTADGSRSDSQLLSGRKRFAREGFGNNADRFGFSNTKRLRGNASSRSADARIGGNDLRLKLTHKRMSRQKQHQVEERKNLELRQNMSRTSQASEGQRRNFVRQVPPEKRAGGILMMEPLRSYSSMSLNQLRREPSDRNPDSSRRLSPPCNNYERRGVPSTRPIDVSGTGRLLNSDVLGPSRAKGPADITVRGTFNAESYKPVRTELLPASGGMLKSSYLAEQPLSVSRLLHSLGLGNYAVQFQAEEVDMAALRQMRDHDLKELGIPMGPRKKILLAILPRGKNQQPN